jgi:hypothetical protein
MMTFEKDNDGKITDKLIQDTPPATATATVFADDLCIDLDYTDARGYKAIRYPSPDAMQEAARKWAEKGVTVINL